MSNAQAIIDAGIAAAHPTPLDESGRFHAVTVPANGTSQVIDLEHHMEQFRDRPRRKRGGYAVHDAASFVAYLAKHGVEESEVWADATQARIIGVVNAHPADAAGWSDHRVTYQVIHTDAWRAWAAHDGKLLDQATFAEHIEDRAIDIIRPAAADMLELAQTFAATIGVRFESSKVLSSGERQLEYRETVEAKAGRAGSLEIPRDFELGLVPFEGADRFKVTARFRYRIADGGLRVGYRLDRPADVLREAFLSVVAAVEDGVSAPVFRGATATT